MELKNVFSTSSETFLPSKHTMYSITVASHGNMILPSSLTKPNSSWDIRRSSLKIIVPRYANGTLKRVPSVVYMTQWPFRATAIDIEHPSASFVTNGGTGDSAWVAMLCLCWWIVFGGHWTKFIAEEKQEACQVLSMSLVCAMSQADPGNVIDITCCFGPNCLVCAGTSPCTASDMFSR